MRAVVQRVLSASVTVVDGADRREIAQIGRGLLILLGVRADDTEAAARWLAERVANLRIFEDEAGKLHLSVRDVSGQAIVVSNFTLYGDCRKGRRPSFMAAASAEHARSLYELAAGLIAAQGIEVSRGEFGAAMEVALINDGPVTLVVDTPPPASPEPKQGEPAQTY